MLEIKNITKIYETDGFTQKALDKVSINFRENEFVSILGASGSGKTTLLNIIGGLDKYTEGDLIINGVSTKDYTDHDWDIYRNHKVGFVFQSYNLIPHQSVLANVELALTLSGVSKKERRKRAIEALKSVGLKDHINKRPNQLSGGQMQRVAIARALVNDPDIVLADEPTGSLDTKTSIQIMDLLKEIAKDRLVIMVTHNPELAENYSTRIINLKDGVVTSDSNPYKENKKATEKFTSNKGKSSMSFKTAVSLSLNNLMTKKGRTILTAFAGSIGIIGICLIMSLSNGIQDYIDKVQEDTLTSYPLTIEAQSVDLSSMISSLSTATGKENEPGKVYSNNIMGEIIGSLSSGITSNNLIAFKEYLEENLEDLEDYVNDIKYTYNVDLLIYDTDTSNGVTKLNPSTVLDGLGMDMSSLSTMSTTTSSLNAWSELSGNEELLESQYDVIAGRLPESYNEVVLIVDDNYSVSDYALYALGLKDQEELYKIYQSILTGEEYTSEVSTYSYDELIGYEFALVLNSSLYKKVDGIWVDYSADEEYMTKVVNNSETITIVGIIKPNDESLISSTSGGIGYRSDLMQYVISENTNSSIAQDQMSNTDINVFTGEAFTETESYDSNLSLIGVADESNPTAINIYANSFESKEEIVDFIEKYNESVSEEDQIEYTDYVGLLMSSVTTIVNVISYVLIAFVSISLIVSSIMIGIITYISVLERTKEIGILRSIGASKKDISSVFNAETFIIGLISGVLGILITWLISIPTNMVLKNLLGISNLCKMPIVGCLSLVLISVVLTIISGLIPAKVASRKDPVEALRTE